MSMEFWSAITGNSLHYQVEMDTECPGCGNKSWWVDYNTPFTAIRLRCSCGMELCRSMRPLRGK